MNYYLPTTEKLLETYIEIGGKKIRGKSLNRTKKDIETALDKINESFDNLLDQFYEDRELDIRSDISTMEVLMKQDGLSNENNNNEQSNNFYLNIDIEGSGKKEIKEDEI